jgi:hypothetical protein
VLEERLGDVTLVGKQLAEQVFDQLRDGWVVVHVAGGESNVEQYAAVVEH